jgi:site-specific DNA-methyltransferase (adenine-specific)
MFSFFGDTILDPFCGTATTMLAAIKTNRNSIGVEIDPAYCEMALKRLEKETRTLFGNTKLEMIKAEELTRVDEEVVAMAVRERAPRLK